MNGGRRPAVGDPAPGFTLPRADCGAVALADYRGRPVLLTFLRHLG